MSLQEFTLFAGEFQIFPNLLNKMELLATFRAAGATVPVGAAALPPSSVPPAFSSTAVHGLVGRLRRFRR